MNRRTFDIIMACKADTEGHSTRLGNVIEFLSEECGTPKEHYTVEEMEKIMFEAMCDYIDTCDKPSAFLYELKNIIGGDTMSSAERICRAFTLVRIKNGETYVNGFNEEFFQKPSEAVINAFEKRLNDAYFKHHIKGSPEADNELNGTNIQVLKEYIALYPNAMFVNLNDVNPIVPAKDKALYNFCCGYVYDADTDVEKTKRIEEIVKSYKNNPNIADANRMYNAIKRAGGLCLIWS